jgi:hypothetical protein
MNEEENRKQLHHQSSSLRCITTAIADPLPFRQSIHTSLASCSGTDTV